jgi:formate C-acetyltransferase
MIEGKMAIQATQDPITADAIEGLSGDDFTNVNRAENVGLGTQAANQRHAADCATPFGASPQNWRRREKFFKNLKHFTLDVTRARCMTEVFRETEGEPQSIRMAQGIARTLAELPILIDDDDLFAGNLTGKAMGSHLYPELVPDYYLADWEALGRASNPVHVAEDDIKVLEEIAPYWRGKTIFDRWDELRPQDDETRNQHGLYFSYNMLAGVGHLIANVPLVLKRGLAGLRGDAVTELNEYKQSAKIPNPERIAFYRSVIISLDGVIHASHRHSEAFRKLADEAIDPSRQAQLNRIAEACAHVPEHPARNSFEALQSALMILFAIAAESSQISICPGRIDQWLAPYVEEDMAAGETPGQIVEWLESFILKLSNWRTYAGEISSELCTITIGGKNSDGTDATTVVTEMIMRAYNHMRLATPPLALRIHAGTPRHVWNSAIRCLSNGCGMPSFMNDEVMIPALKDLKFSDDDAHNYADIGCVEMGSAGTSLGPVSIGFINIAKCFEIAINDGQCMLTNEQLGPKTGTLESQATFSDVLAAYDAQLAFAVDRFCR